MSLLDDARDESKPIRPPCTIATLDEGLRDEVEEALDDPSVTATGVSRALARRGVKVSAQTMRRHYRGDCTCEPR